MNHGVDKAPYCSDEMNHMLAREGGGSALHDSSDADEEGSYPPWRSDQTEKSGEADYGKATWLTM
jgi:hypothetical protein